MIPIHVILNHYKRKDVQEEMIYSSKNREVVARFDDKFGNRPDTLNYSKDILELAKQGATSFHSSEELWKNPLLLNPNLKKSELDDMRIGWDLVLDVDCPIFELSKIICWLIVKSLKEHNINYVSVKFSGNKGFHIGIPFESFHSKIIGIETKNLFPEAPRKIAYYLLDYIANKHIEVKSDEVIFGKKNKILFQKLMKITGKNIDELSKKYCSDCNNGVEESKIGKTEFICKKCGSSVISDTLFMKCNRCNIFMEKIEYKTGCKKCGSKYYYRKFDALSIIDVDTILISSRHLYRMPYSLHEKSGLVSLPINPDKVLEFKKEDAKPENMRISEFRFLDRDNAIKGEAKQLITQAFDFTIDREEEINIGAKRSYEIPQAALKEELFPPCIKKIMDGLEDGRKRSVFILLNFLTSVGWNYNAIEKLLKEWNKKNNEPLREVYTLGQLRYHKQSKKKILPPNCPKRSNNIPLANQQNYYTELGICNPDNLCTKIKNPVSYALRKGFYQKKEKIKEKA